MADKPKLPAPAGGETRAASAQRRELLLRASQRLPRAALRDLVEDWKRLALSAAVPAPPRTEKSSLLKLSTLPLIGAAIASWKAFRQRRDLQWKLEAWTAIGARDPFLAHSAIARLHEGAIDLHLIASYLDSCNRRDEALELLTRARALGHRSRDTSKLLIDLLFGRGQHDAVARVASADAALLSPAERQAIDAALRAHTNV
jgi:hypothetical protein